VDKPGRSTQRCRPVLYAILAFLWLLTSGSAVAQTPGRDDTLILADPADPYYALAQEIAQREALPIVPTLDETLARDPTFVLWVVSPGFLSDQVMVDFGLALRQRPSAVSVGIISGMTLDDARTLWLRAPQAEAGRVFAANALNPAGNIEAELIEFGQEGRTTQPLSLANLLESLPAAGYFTFSGHGGSSYLRLEGDTKLQTGQIPPTRNRGRHQ
jgi:hypothetical protein